MPEIWILYFYQGELGESIETPNAFSIQCTSPNSQLTLREVLAYFPVATTNNLIFRARANDEQHGYIWIDLDDTEQLPRLRSGEIFLKVLRIDEDSVLRRKTNLKRKEKSEMKVPVLSGQQSNRAPTRPPAYGSDVPAQTNTTTATNTKRNLDSSNQEKNDHASSIENLKITPPRSQHQAQAKDESSILDFNSNSEGVDHPDLVDFGSFVQATPSPASGLSKAATPERINAPILSREELVQKRLDEVKDRVNTALEFKHEIDDNQKREAEELEAARTKHDARLTTWAFNGSEKRNVRTLLSTMHTVLWPECKWKPVGLGDVIDAKQVKLQYRKAMLVVHPDRSSGLSGEVRFIAKRVFEAINEAYQDFLKKESVE